MKQEIEAKGHEVWFDEQLDLGTAWSTEIEQRIQNCDCLLAVVSRESTRSQMCRAEQLFAMNHGRAVIPIRIHADAPWPLHLVGLNGVEATDGESGALPIERLLQVLQLISDQRESPVVSRPMPRGVLEPPPISEPFIARSDELGHLRDAILSRGAQPTTALTGCVGVGKTALALALCHDAEARTWFSDGIFWIHSGVRGPALARSIGALCAALDPPMGGRESAALDALAGDHSFLLVCDDVESASDITPFRFESPRSRLLITTLDATVAHALDAHIIGVDAPKSSDREWIGAYAGLQTNNVPYEAARIVSDLGSLPLVAEVVGKALRRRPDPDSAPALLFEVLLGDPKLERALQNGLRALTGWEKQRLFELGIFSEYVPPTVVERLWGMSEVETYTQLTRFCHLSLCKIDRNGTFGLHPAYRALARHELGAAGSQQAHERLLVASGDERDEYWRRHLAFHMLGAGRRAELEQRLLTFEGLTGEIERAGVDDVLDMFNEASEGSWRLVLVEHALQLGRFVLRDQPQQLAGQIVARISSAIADEPVRQLVADARARSVLVPIETSMFRAGGTLARQMPIGRNAALQPGMLGGFLVASHHSSAGVWDTFRSLQIGVLQTSPAAAAAYALSIVVPGAAGQLRVWDVRTRTDANTFDVDAAPAKLLAVSSDARVAASSSDSKTVVLVDLQNGARLSTLSHDKEIMALRFVAGDKYLLTTATDAPMATLWDIATGRVLQTIYTRVPSPDGQTSPYTTPRAIVAVADDNRQLALFDGFQIKLWELEGSEAKPTASIDHYKGAALRPSLALDRFADLVIAGGSDGQVTAWQASTGNAAWEFVAHAGQVSGVVATGRHELFTAGDDGFLRVWSLQDERLNNSPHGSAETARARGIQQVSSIAISSDGRWAASGSFDGCVRVYDVGTRRNIRTIHAHERAVTAVAFAGHTIVSASWDYTVAVSDVETGFLKRRFRGHSDDVGAVATSRDGRLAVSVCLGAKAIVWDLRRRFFARRLTFTKHSRYIDVVAVSQDGSLALTSSDDKTYVWRTDTGEVVHALDGVRVWHAVFGPDNRRVFVGGYENGWLDVASGRTRTPDRHFALMVQDLGLSEDGRTAVVLRQHDVSVLLIDATALTVKAEFCLDAPATAAAVSPDGRTVIVGDLGGGLSFFTATP